MREYIVTAKLPINVTFTGDYSSTKLPAGTVLRFQANSTEDSDALKRAVSVHCGRTVSQIPLGTASWKWETIGSNGERVSAGTGPDMTFWMKDVGKVASGAGKLIKNAHDRHKAQKEQEEQERSAARDKAFAELEDQIARMSAEEEAKSQAALPNLVRKMQQALPEEESFAQNTLLQIKDLPLTLSSSDWIPYLKKAKSEAKVEHYSDKMQHLVNEAKNELVSEDLKKLKREANYNQYSVKIKKAWADYAKKLRGYVEEHYSNTEEYKRFIIEDSYEDVEKMVSKEWNTDRLELPKDANHAIAFISYAHDKMMDMDLDSDKRKEWKKCYKKAIKQAKGSFPDNADVMVLVSKAADVKNEYFKANLLNAWPAKLFGGILLFIPLIACLCMESIGWGIFLAICWIVLYFFASKALGLGEIIREIFKKSKIQMIIWWVWLFLTFFLLLAGEEFDFEWYHYVLTVVGSLIAGFIMIEVEA